MIIPDEFGKCIKCHKDLIIEKVIDGQLKRVLTPDYGEIQVELDDGSKMRVVMCLTCQEIYTEKDFPTIMASVVAGWQKELNNLPYWNEEKKDNYMKKYSKLKIKSKVKEFSYGVNH